MATSAREIRRRIEAIDGLEIVAIVPGKHWNVTVRTPNGKTHLVVMSISESDWRVPKKQRAQLRKLLKENS